MRIPRTILLGLSPLLSLWALGAQLGTEMPGNRYRAQTAEQLVTTDTLQRFIEPMVSFLLLAAEQDQSVTAAHPRVAQDLFSLDALQFTSFRHSVWLVRKGPATDFHSRKNPSSLLRC